MWKTKAAVFVGIQALFYLGVSFVTWNFFWFVGVPDLHSADRGFGFLVWACMTWPTVFFFFCKNDKETLD